MTKYFAAPLVLIILIATVLFGPGWLFPAVFVLMVAGGLGYARWPWVPGFSPANIRVWFRENRTRLAWTVSFFMTFILVAALIVALWYRYAPECTGCPAGLLQR